MTKHTVYAYVIPDDDTIDGISVVQRVNEFISSRQWLCSDIWAVNQTRETGECDLGLNIAIPEPHQEPIGWFSDIEAIVGFCVQLRPEFSCDFVLGIAESGSSHAEDVIEIENDSPNIEYLKKLIGIESPSAANQP